MRKSRQRERLSVIASHPEMTNVELARALKVSERQIYTDRRAMRLAGGVQPTPETQAPAPETPAPAPQPTRQQLAEEAGRAYDLSLTDPSATPERRHQLLCKFICFTDSTPPREER